MDYFKITTDETLRETVQHGSERYPFAYYPEDIWQFDFHRIDWHWHHELEFLYVAEGTAICFIGTSKVELHKGCGIFINSGVLHCFANTERYRDNGEITRIHRILRDQLDSTEYNRRKHHNCGTAEY